MPNPTTKVCSKCKETKPFSAFYQISKAGKKMAAKNPDGTLKLGGAMPRCKACSTADYRDKYHTMKEKEPSKYKAFRDRQQKNRIVNGMFVANYLKTHPCIDCGEGNILVLEFDHRDPRTKATTIAKLMARGHPTIEQLQTEIDKCDVRCANCHRIRTAQSANWRKILWALQEV